MPLNLQPNLSEPGKRYFQTFTPGDDFYEALIETHRDLTDDQSALVTPSWYCFCPTMLATSPYCARRCKSRATPSKFFKNYP